MFYNALSKPDQRWLLAPRRWPLWTRGLAGYLVLCAVFFPLAWAIGGRSWSQAPTRFAIWLIVMLVVDSAVTATWWYRRRTRQQDNT